MYVTTLLYLPKELKFSDSSAIEAAKQALDDAVAATGSMDAIELYTVDIETSEAAKAFNEAEAMIHECFKKYQVS
jgi:hypothetical protein